MSSVDGTAASAIEQQIAGRTRDLGGFEVRRVLPAFPRQRVGPFIFFDHFGPVTFPPGHGMDVRPHPHIGLATVTYLFEGEMLHRDSLGSLQTIRPGDVNWMVAGRGIVHSERTPADARAHGREHARPAAVGGAADRGRGGGAALRAPRDGDPARGASARARRCG